jgi:hypothetical protein
MVMGCGADASSTGVLRTWDPGRADAARDHDTGYDQRGGGLTVDAGSSAGAGASPEGGPGTADGSGSVGAGGSSGCLPALAPCTRHIDCCGFRNGTVLCLTGVCYDVGP